MNFFQFSSLFIIIFSFLMAVLSFLKSGNRPSRIFVFVCLSAGIWGVGGYGFSLASDPESALFWWQIAYISIISAPVLYSHFVFSYLNLNKRWLLFVLYMAMSIFIFLDLFYPKVFLGNVKFLFNEIYWHDWTQTKSFIYLFYYICFYWILLPYSFLLLLLSFIKAVGLKRQQTKYFILGSIFSWIGAECNFFPDFGIMLYPIPNFLVGIYPIIFGYAIIRYRLLDITLAITRTGIFIAVYSLVLGLPFALAFGWRQYLIYFFGEMWWIVPLVTLTILATAGPFIYLYIQRRAEARLLQEQRRYQSTLRQASLGMGKVKDLKKLLHLIIHIVTRTVKLESGAIYLYDNLEKKYLLKASRDHDHLDFYPAIPKDSALTKYLVKIRSPLVYDEIKQRIQDASDESLIPIESEIKNLNAALVVPSFVEDKLLAIVCLGKKKSGKLYSEEDLAVFSILANQAALAIENAQFYEDVKRTQEQLFQAEKMATIGTMADGLSHQLNNRFHALGFIAADALDSIKLKSQAQMSEEIKYLVEDLEHSLSRILDNVKQGGEIVQGLLKYTRKGEVGFSEVDLNQLVDSALEMAQYKIKLEQFTFTKDFSGSIPKILGNFTQLQEVFFNLFDNGYDALMQKKAEWQAPDYKPEIRVSAQPIDNGQLKILVRDNGIGVKDEDKEKLFTPFFTTKLSSKKGTGLGLYVIQKIIEENHSGSVKIESKYGQGTMITIVLPVPS